MVGMTGMVVTTRKILKFLSHRQDKIDREIYIDARKRRILILLSIKSVCNEF